MNLTADEFNAKFPVGTAVRYWPVLPAVPSIPPRETKTRSAAWTLGDGHPVVMIEGLAGCVSILHLEHSEPLPAPVKSGQELMREVGLVTVPNIAERIRCPQEEEKCQMNIYIWARRDGTGIPFVSVDPSAKPPYDVSDKEKWVRSHAALDGLSAEDVLRRDVEMVVAQRHRQRALLESLPIDTQVVLDPLLRRMEGLEIELGSATLRMDRQSETILRHAAMLDELKNRNP
jgi:hypothetical protein